MDQGFAILLAAAASAGLDGEWVLPSAAANLPAAAGAYVLALRLELPVPLPRFDAELPPGCYAYLGSARGPGGLRARLARHFRTQKKPHWHIDRLTIAVAEMAAMAIPEAAECDLAAALLATGLFRIPIPGFGSTDCRRCESHLLVLQ